MSAFLDSKSGHTSFGKRSKTLAVGRLWKTFLPWSSGILAGAPLKSRVIEWL